MRHQHTCFSKGLRRVAISAVIFAAASAFAIQDSPAAQAVTPRHAHAATKESQERASSRKSDKSDQDEYGPLITELASLATKLQQGVQIPAPRSHSKLLPFVPGSSTVYVSVPNYGEALYQADQIFNQELQQSKALSDWWQNKVGPTGMMVEAVIDQVHQFMAYLGEEIVISGNVKEKGGSMLIAAEVRKPGLKAYLQQLLDQYGGPNSPVQILTPQQLATAKAPPKDKPFIVLVRPDFLVVASEIGMLRSFNAQLDRGSGTFATTPFGERLAQAYQGGVGFLAGADLQPLLAMRPHGSQQSETFFQESGFGDLKYAILDGKYSGGIAASNIELSFNGPRKGFAGWVGLPTDLGSLDFVSPKAAYAMALILKKPAQLFDDIKSLMEASNPTAFNGLEQMQTELGIDFKQDLLSKLTGQLAFALESPLGPAPVWKAIIQVSDPDGLQNTVKKLLAAVNAKGDGKGVTLEQKSKDGLTYTRVEIPNLPKQEIAYAFIDGYLVAASSPALLKEAVDMHRNGTSLAKSGEFRKLLPLEHSGQASAVIFQNVALTLASMAQQIPQEASQLVQSLAGKDAYSVMSLVGEPTALRVTTNSHALDLGVPLIIAAIAIPNLTRSRDAANQASAAATIRIVNTAQVSYQVTYGKGFAPDLAKLGAGSGGGDCGGKTTTAEHACLLDLGPTCSSGTSCIKNGFQITMAASCGNNGCDDYVVTGTPVDTSKRSKSFCSTSDAVVRSKSGPPPPQPISADDCRTWEPM